MVISVDFPVFLNVAGENLNQPISLNYTPPLVREGGKTRGGFNPRIWVDINADCS